MSWSRKTWLVTGTSSGFGLAIARAVLRAGGNIAATARDPSALAALKEMAPDRVLAVRLDVTRPDQISAAVAEANAAFGRIDVLVNNAGYGFQGGVEESSDAEIREQFEVNFFGLAAVTRAALPIMRRQRAGYIVNFSSVAGFMGIGGVGWYSATKFAVAGFSEALAQEAEPLGIRVMIVEPGPFRTDFGGRSIRRPADTIPDYEIVTARRSHTDIQDGKQPGDPDRAALAIIAAMDDVSPPLWLQLGKVANQAAATVFEKRLQAVTACEALALGADYPAD
jgi:NAD(P)-dependent dehydrogenase (short-subunit alcohol dehydrogenase family)